MKYLNIILIFLSISGFTFSQKINIELTDSKGKTIKITNAGLAIMGKYNSSLEKSRTEGVLEIVYGSTPIFFKASKINQIDVIKIVDKDNTCDVIIIITLLSGEILNDCIVKNDLGCNNPSEIVGESEFGDVKIPFTNIKKIVFLHDDND